MAGHDVYEADQFLVDAVVHVTRRLSLEGVKLRIAKLRVLRLSTLRYNYVHKTLILMLFVCSIDSSTISPLQVYEHHPYKACTVRDRCKMVTLT